VKIHRKASKVGYFLGANFILDSWAMKKDKSSCLQVVYFLRNKQIKSLILVESEAF